YTPPPNSCPSGTEQYGYWGSGAANCVPSCPTGYSRANEGAANTIPPACWATGSTGAPTTPPCLDANGCSPTEHAAPSPCSPSTTACFPNGWSGCPSGQEYGCSDIPQWKHPSCVSCSPGYHYVGLDAQGTGGFCIDANGRTPSQNAAGGSLAPTAF